MPDEALEPREEKQLAEDLAAISQNAAKFHKITREYAFEMLRRLASEGSREAGRALLSLSRASWQRKRTGRYERLEPSTGYSHVGPFSGRVSGETLGDLVRSKQEKSCSN